MIVIVTGSRTWSDEATITAALDQVVKECRTAGDKILVVRHGACPPAASVKGQRNREKGADEIASQWVRVRDRVLRNFGMEVFEDRRPAQWRRFPRGQAGFIRNAEMVKDGADLLLAFNRYDENGKPSRGATDCTRAARRAGIPQRIWTATHEDPRGVRWTEE